MSPSRKPGRHQDARSVYRARVFIADQRGGNAAGVVPDATGLSAQAMTRIAAGVGASETAFLFPSTNADARIRWFTPTTEVSLCIHATIAAAGVLSRLHRPIRRRIAFESTHSTLRVSVDETKASVSVGPFTRSAVRWNDRLVHEALGIRPEGHVGRSQVIRISGERELVTEVRGLHTLLAVCPNRRRLAMLCRRVGADGITLFAYEPFGHHFVVYAREFAPLYGYLEDPACGLGAGAIAALLHPTSGERSAARVEFVTSGSIVQVRRNGRMIRIGGQYVLL